MKLATVSVDLDNLWCYQRSFGKPQWQTFSSFLHLAIPRLLQFLNERKIKATFFIVGKDASEATSRALLLELIKNGHEVANHSYWHNEHFHQLSQTQIVNELRDAHQAILEATGHAPIGFRGPAFGLSQKLIESLHTLGYQYDASTFPSSLGALARRYQRNQSKSAQVDLHISEEKFGKLSQAWQTIRPHHINKNSACLIEIPVTTSPILRLPCHGTYLQFAADKSSFLALTYFRSVELSYRACAVSPSFLLHATDFLGSDDNLGLDYLPGMQRTATEKTAFMHRVFDVLQKHHAPLGLGKYCELFKKGNHESLND